jgi:hypothetical protein
LQGVLFQGRGANKGSCLCKIPLANRKQL